jgi:iron complex outermembrane recepter protein
MYPSIRAPLVCAAAFATVVSTSGHRALAQTSTETTELPEVVVVSDPEASPATAPKKKPASPSSQASPSAPTTQPPTGSFAARTGSLSVPSTAEARVEIERTPGSVEIVPDTAYKTSTPALTAKDVLDYVPGVFAQPKWGDDTRLSIRGSGLSRNFHLRGLQLYMDGIPISTADGFSDFHEIDPTAYRYVEVYKGANALRFGANSLGGAINFVMPTGYDADLFGARVDFGSFGFRKTAVSSGGVSGAADYFITGTWQEQDGFRDHSDGESVRGSMNLGYRLSEDAETRFYLNANWVRQRIPGAVTKESALTNPQAAWTENVSNDWQRNIDTIRFANKTAVRLAPGTLLEIGAFATDRHLMHPIFRWLDYKYNDYGGFARLVDETTIAGYRNRLIVGASLHNGTTAAKQYEIGPGAAKGDILSDVDQDSQNVALYAENSFYFLRDVALVTGTQFLHATRQQEVHYTSVFDSPGQSEFNLWSPKVGLLWDVDPGWQVFANISRSAEIPSFGENTVSGTPFSAKEQRATTYEIGTRGVREDYTWDFTLYRAEIDDELQCLTVVVNPFYTNTCSVANVDSTVHQGVEAGFGAAVAKSLFVAGRTPDKLWLNTAYTYNDFFFDDDTEFGDNDLPGAPRHFLRAELLYKHPSGVYFGPNVEWVPQAYYVDNANTLKTEGYGIWGAKIGFDDGGPVTAYIEGRNLADEAYIASTSIAGDLTGLPPQRLFEPGTGRSVYAGVQINW